jgi:hypothetical protein
MPGNVADRGEHARSGAGRAARHQHAASVSAMQTPRPPRSRQMATPPSPWANAARSQPSPQIGDYLLALVLCVGLIGIVAGLWYMAMSG